MGYTITIDPHTAGTSITGAELVGNFGISRNLAFTESTKSNGFVLDVAFGSNSDSAVFASVPSLTSLTVLTIPTLGFLISLEETYLQPIGTVSEPATLAVVSLGTSSTRSIA